jgi:hypothetical protein
MVLLEIDIRRVLSLELEGDAPSSIDMHGVARWRVAQQGVEIEAGKVHVVDLLRGIESIETGQDALMHFGIYPGRGTFGPQLAQSLASE